MAILPLAPVPPVLMQVAPGPEHIITLVMATLTTAAFLFALVHWYRSGRPIVMLLFLAGGCMMVMEPMVDTVSGCWFAADSTLGFVGWGRPIPLWVCLTYFAYFGIGAAVIWIGMQRGLTRVQIWYFFLGEVLADTVLESVLLRVGLYTYYGNQPLSIGGFPLWWAAVNALVSVVAAAVTLQVARRLNGWKVIALIPVLLSTSAAANAAAGWPAWFVINSDVGPIWATIGGLVSCAIAFACVAVIAALVAVPPSAGAHITARPHAAA